MTAGARNIAHLNMISRRSIGDRSAPFETRGAVTQNPSRPRVASA
jgi:hypothetical protein